MDKEISILENTAHYIWLVSNMEPMLKKSKLDVDVFTLVYATYFGVYNFENSTLEEPTHTIIGPSIDTNAELKNRAVIYFVLNFLREENTKEYMYNDIGVENLEEYVLNNKDITLPTTTEVYELLKNKK